MSSRFKLTAAPFTPFHPDGSLNLAAVEKYASHLVENGVNGAFVCGTTGEGTSLTMDERMRLARRWVDVAGDDLSVFVHVGNDCLADACALAEHAGQIGAAAIGALSPVFFKPATAEDLVNALAPVAASAAQLPFYYYHIPSMTGVQVTASEFLQAASERIPNLAGVKFTDYDIPEFRECGHLQGGRYETYFGRDERLVEGLRAGAAGAIGSTYNFLAPQAQEIIDAFAHGDFSAADGLQGSYAAFIDVIFHIHGGLPAAKALMAHMGMDCGPVRSPLPQMTQSKVETMLQALEAVGFPFAPQESCIAESCVAVG